ncbi:ribonuclease III [Lachnospiraceae bacterium ZAX-1]
MHQAKEFQQKIGYQFLNERLLIQALTHSSYANEQHMGRLENNERLEFLGDAVLEIVSSEFLYENYETYPEGELTRLRASLVCEQTLAFCTKELDLGKYLLLGKGEALTGGRERKSVLSDAFEAVIGAIYLDGGFANAKEFIFHFVLEDIDKKQLFFDSKTILQEAVQGNYKEELHYHIVNEEGPDHDKKFVVEVHIGEKAVGRGEGKTKKSAEQEAAYYALLELKKHHSDVEGKTCI